jgi:transglutaminase-like putative cysteine protease
VPDVLRTRRGVCQDFAHLTIAGLRGLGLAARYVSGYLATDPPPGRARVVGADATHAWVECWVPGPDGTSGWLSVDPTNDCVTGERHVTVAWGRDYADVPPVKGVILTEAAESTMTVTVDVEQLA